MAVYAIAQLTITDPEAYGRYQERFMGVFKKFRGTILASDTHPLVLEGTWDREKVVLLSFPDREAFQAWAFSPEYEEIAQDRRAGADAVILLVKGLG